jgi:hypothetical protein
MKLSLDCYNEAAIGCRKLQKVLDKFLPSIGLKAPHHSTIKNWIWRYGCACLDSPNEKRDDWIAIGDLTVCLGKMKVLAVLGVKADEIKKRQDLTLTYQDVEILELAPCIKSNGLFVCKTFNDASNRVSGGKGALQAIVIDRGSDIKKGAHLYQKSHPLTKVIHDITHKLSNVMEKALKDHPIWIAYTKELTLTRHRVQNTEFAAMMPPVQRRDARFMDISDIVLFRNRTLRIKKSGNLEGITSEERFNEYLGWLDKYEIFLNECETMVGAAEMIKENTRQHWISKEVYEYLKMNFGYCELEEGIAKEFIDNAMKTVLEEVEKLGDGETMLASTEVLESIFGKFKQINFGSEQGVSGNVLGICTFVGGGITEEKIISNMEKCSTNAMKKWVDEHVGDNSIGRLRKKIFKNLRTKFDEKIEDENVA